MGFQPMFRTMADTRYNPLLHLTAALTVAATLPLIFMGGLVTSHGAGMSVPDWPNSYGYNMFTFPPSKWIGGIFYEHTHRLMGTVVGMLSIALTILAWKLETRRWVQWLCTGVLTAVIAQGVLGGLRVVLVELDLAVVHACFAQAFLCLAVFASIVTSKWWLAQPDAGFQPVREPRHGLKAYVTPVNLAITAGVVIYLQLVVGAMMRHYAAGLAIPDLPLNYGQVLPPTDAASLQQANLMRIDLHLPAVTLGQIWLHFGHRIGAVLITILLVALSARVLRHETSRALRVPAMLLIALLLIQLTLGILTVLWQKPADIASLHVAFGALTLMTTFTIIVRSLRLYPLRRIERSQGTEGMLVPV